MFPAVVVCDGDRQWQAEPPVHPRPTRTRASVKYDHSIRDLVVGIRIQSRGLLLHANPVCEEQSDVGRPVYQQEQ